MTLKTLVASDINYEKYGDNDRSDKDDVVCVWQRVWFVDTFDSCLCLTTPKIVCHAGSWVLMIEMIEMMLIWTVKMILTRMVMMMISHSSTCKDGTWQLPVLNNANKRLRYWSSDYKYRWKY